jgi:CheY-like chemotaxis protein
MDNGSRIMLVEADEINQIVALGILGQLGYPVDVASDGAQALNLAESNAYLAVFLDCQTPQLDGYEIARRFRELEQPSRGHTPIIAMAPSIVPGDRERCLAAGMDDYIAKPIRRDTVNASLSRWLGSAIDREQVDELRSRGTAEGDPLMKVTVPFLDEAPALLDDLHGALALSDTTALAPLAHNLKGLATAVGASAMTALCTTIAAQGRQGDLAGAVATVTQLRAEFDRARAELERIAGEPR